MSNKPSYHELKAKLDQQLAQLSEDIDDIDAAIKHYNDAQQTIKEIEKYLAGAKTKVKLVKKKP